MSRLALTIIFVAIIATPNDSLAQLAELLTPVTGVELAEARARNEYFLKKHSYRARNHRIVTADFELLRSGEALVIPLFDGESLTVEPSSFEDGSIQSTLSWKGTIANPLLSINDLQGTGGSAVRAKIMHEALFGVRIGAALWRYDAASGANFPYYPSMGPRPPRNQSQGHFAAYPLYYGMRANIWVKETSKRYLLQPLEMGGPYHILIEIDPTKVVPPGPANDPEVARMRPERIEFMKSLGEDPRKAIIRQEETQ